MSASRYWPAALVVAVPLGIYSAFLGLSANPFFQRHFLYAHRVQTLWWNDVNEPEKWGFAKNQVTPFNLTSEDGETIYAWHILPLPLYSQHEGDLIKQPGGLNDDFASTLNFRLLKNDPKSKLVIYLHGNAGHVAQAIRPASYHALTDTSSYHVLAIDYRGFGHSTGTPTEAGVILDASAAVDFILDTASLSPSRVVILGQSLGTAVACGVAERYARRGIDFAGVVLVSGFADLAGMLSDYAIAGWVPVLRPLKKFAPWLLSRVLTYVVDKWQSADRLKEMTRLVKARGGRVRLNLVHAADDWDIPCHEDDKLFAGAVNGMAAEEGGIDDKTLARKKDGGTVGKGKDAFVATWIDGDIIIRQELFPYGGHNDIMMYAPVALAVMRSFDLDGTAQQ